MRTNFMDIKQSFQCFRYYLFLTYKILQLGENYVADA